MNKPLTTDTDFNEVKINLNFMFRVGQIAVYHSRNSIERLLSEIQHAHMRRDKVSSVTTDSLVSEANAFAASNEFMNAVNYALENDNGHIRDIRIVR